MLKLLIRNKIVEMFNFFHYLWTEGELVLKYFAVLLLSSPICIFAWFKLVMYYEPKNPIWAVIVVSTVYHVGCFMTAWILHSAFLSVVSWIKSNIEIAKRNEKVTPNWKR